MKLRIATALMALVVFALAVPQAKSDDNDSTARTVTGCLQKGESANEYTLMAKDGSTWEVSSDTVNLAPHVGHTVTITANPSRVHEKAHEMKEGAKDKMQEHDMKKSNAEHGHLKVDNLTMVSESCQK
ncbi:MAG: hypothetical protein ACR2IF_18075 [Terriglobales bacterium]